MNDLEIEKSKKWIEDFVNKCNKIIEESEGEHYTIDELNYENIMKHMDYAANSSDVNGEEYMLNRFDMGNFEVFVLDDYKFSFDELWYHYGIVRSKKVEENKKKNFFSCSC